ncbi:MAG: M1 family metallopeptidase [Planctomycetes bacterium]|nr:M1 family metallopeptidase [Planctomycetota bacterium]
MRALLTCSLLLFAACGGGDSSVGLLAPDDGPFVRDTGGILKDEQACYDVQHYDLDMQVFPDRREIAATLHARIAITASTDKVLFNLDPALAVEEVLDHAGGALAFEHHNDLLMVGLSGEAIVGEVRQISIRYGGRPRTAPRPPWEGGFQWEQTPSGAHWIATACQMEGADLWWPCKDHPSDKAESVDLHFRVPSNLVAASNGKLDRIEDHEDGTVTYHWKVSTPIPNYAVALNIAPYEKLEAQYTSVAGTPLPVQFWVLPESIDNGRKILPEFVDHLRWFEQTLGPYPFRADKYGVVETPHLGMEHQTIIAYGNQFRPFRFGFDWLHHHELAHEWFSNLVTAPDWNDFWIHEGFGSYVQKLYVEDREGAGRYREYLASVRGNLHNVKSVAPREPRSSAQMYFLDASAPEGKKPSDSDIYYKGEWVLHTLRWLIGKGDLMSTFRKMCYSDSYASGDESGGAVHFFTTDDYVDLVEAETGLEMGWFFELYIRQPELPELVVKRHSEDVYHFSWKTPGNIEFPMPIEVFIGGVPRRLEIPVGGSTVIVPVGASIEIDPFDRVLRKHNHCLGG